MRARSCSLRSHQVLVEELGAFGPAPRALRRAPGVARWRRAGRLTYDVDVRDRDLYSQILGISSPWSVNDVKLDLSASSVEVVVGRVPGAKLACPECGKQCPGYDSRERKWRHLDTCQLRTFLVAEVPRVNCPEHGVLFIKVPWAEAKSRFTAMFERLVIDWLRETKSIVGVARILGLTWDEVDGVQRRAVQRGLQRRVLEAPERIGVDETSFQKRREYVTVVCDLDRGTVLHVADGHGKQSLSSFYEQLNPQQLANIKVVAMDMWKPFIAATQDALEGAEEKIAFDKFHVAQHLNEAVDRVRRTEHRELCAFGDPTLTNTRYVWMMSPTKHSDAQRIAFDILKRSSLKTARAWAIKDAASRMWDHGNREAAATTWRSWLQWAVRSRLEPIKRVASMVREHLDGIVTAIVTRTTSALVESINSTIQRIKGAARGFRSRDRYRHAIYFHLGGLDLYPISCKSTHTRS